MPITFDPVAHTYTLDGVRLPSVSEIIKAGGLMPQFYGHLPPHYKHRGTMTHLACQYDDENALDDSTVDPQIAPRVNAYRQWKKDYEVFIDINEMVVHHKDEKYAGTLDKIARIGQDKYVLDLKGESPVSYHPIQTIAYKKAMTCEVDYPFKRAALYLKKNGKYKFVVHDDDTADWGKFLQALEAYRKGPDA